MKAKVVHWTTRSDEERRTMVVDLSRNDSENPNKYIVPVLGEIHLKGRLQ